jgi:hypothetical protein
MQFTDCSGEFPERAKMNMICSERQGTFNLII